jgi:hypothetical protein
MVDQLADYVDRIGENGDRRGDKVDPLIKTVDGFSPSCTVFAKTVDRFAA